MEYCLVYFLFLIAILLWDIGEKVDNICTDIRTDFLWKAKVDLLRIIDVSREDGKLTVEIIERAIKKVKDDLE